MVCFLFLRAAYEARGAHDKIVFWDESEAGGDAEQLGYCAVWIKGVWSGLTCVEAMFAAVANVKEHSAYHVPGDRSGAWQQTDGTNAQTPVTANG